MSINEPRALRDISAPAAVRLHAGPLVAIADFRNSGRIAEAVELLVSAWPRLPEQVREEDARAVISDLVELVPAADRPLLFAIERLLSETPWGSAAGVAQVELPSTARANPIGDLSASSRVVMTAAAVSTLTAQGRLTQAVALGARADAVDTYSDDSDSLLAEALPFLWNAIAVAHMTAGDSKNTIRYAVMAEHLAESLNLPGCLFSSIALQAAALALNGEMRKAAMYSARAAAMSESNGWTFSDAHFPLAFVRMVALANSIDATEASTLAADIGNLFPDRPMWNTSSRIVVAYRDLRAGDITQGIAMIRIVLNEADERGLRGISRDFALGVYADLLLAGSRGGEVLALLDDKTSPRGHSICFAQSRAAAYLSIGRPRDAIEATDACTAMGELHSLRTLPSALLVRAVAYHRLGAESEADALFLEALLIADATGTQFSTPTVPRATIDALGVRVGIPDAFRMWTPGGSLDDRRAAGSGDLGPAGLGSLTPRELELARLVRKGLPSADIAANLFLSPNTVKAHLRNLYRKLGVNSRVQAAGVIDSLGIHGLPARERA